MKERIELSKIEQDVMEVIWTKEDISGAEITYLLKGDKEKAISREMVKLYVHRLIEKGFVAVKKISPRIHRYYALVERDEYMAGEVEVFLKRHKNSAKHLIASLIDSDEIKSDDIKEIEQMILDCKKRDQ